MTRHVIGFVPSSFFVSFPINRRDSYLKTKMRRKTLSLTRSHTVSESRMYCLMKLMASIDDCSRSVCKYGNIRKSNKIDLLFNAFMFTLQLKEAAGQHWRAPVLLACITNSSLFIYEKRLILYLFWFLYNWIQYSNKLDAYLCTEFLMLAYTSLLFGRNSSCRRQNENTSAFYKPYWHWASQPSQRCTHQKWIQRRRKKSMPCTPCTKANKEMWKRKENAKQKHVK